MSSSSYSSSPQRAGVLPGVGVPIVEHDRGTTFVAAVRSAPKQVRPQDPPCPLVTRGDATIADRRQRTCPARLIRALPGTHERLPGKAQAVRSGGRQATDACDPAGLRTPRRLFQSDLEIPRGLVPVYLGAPVLMRFRHRSEVLAQWRRRLRQRFLSRFDV